MVLGAVDALVNGPRSRAVLARLQVAQPLLQFALELLVPADQVARLVDLLGVQDVADNAVDDTSSVGPSKAGSTSSTEASAGRREFTKRPAAPNAMPNNDIQVFTRQPPMVVAESIRRLSTHRRPTEYEIR